MRSLSLYAIISLSGMVFGAEIVSSHVTQSLVLLTSAYHMLYNLLSLLLLVISHRTSRGKTLKNTFGWVRIKVLGLLVNMLFLSALCFSVCVEAIQTVVHALHENTEPRYPRLLVLLGFADFILNIICFLLIGGFTHHQGCSMIIQGNDVQVNCVLSHSETNKNEKGEISPIEKGEISPEKSNNILPTNTHWCWDHHLLDLSRDVSSCLAVVSCGCIILFMDGLILKYADAILAVASVIVLASTTYPFVRESGLILLQSIPNHIDVEGLTKRLLFEFQDVLNIHDLHVWRLTTSEVIATVHVMLHSPINYTGIEKKLTQFFRKEGISSVTVQPEFTNKSLPEKQQLECILQCSSNNNCGALTCCGPLTERSKQTSARQRNIPSTTPSQQNFSENDINIPTLNNISVPIPQYDFGNFASAIETAL